MKIMIKSIIKPEVKISLKEQTEEEFKNSIKQKFSNIEEIEMIKEDDSSILLFIKKEGKIEKLLIKSKSIFTISRIIEKEMEELL